MYNPYNPYIIYKYVNQIDLFILNLNISHLLRHFLSKPSNNPTYQQSFLIFP